MMKTASAVVFRVGGSRGGGARNPISHLTELNLGWPDFYNDSTPTAFQRKSDGTRPNARGFRIQPIPVGILRFNPE